MRTAPLITLDQSDARQPTSVGNKFAHLADCRDLAPIPDAVCVPVDWFSAALGSHRRDRLAAVVAEIAATAGNDLLRNERAIRRCLEGLAPTRAMRSDLHHWLTRMSGGQWAVRSSTTVEDGAVDSHAGMYDTILNVGTPDDVESSLITCWRSFYSLRAILGRIRAGDEDPEPRMAVIVQAMITPDEAGVAFTQGGTVAVETIKGSGEQLVSGQASAPRHLVHNAEPDQAPDGAVARLARTIAAHCRTEIDIEWAREGDRVWLLQARPVTAAPLIPTADTSPLFASESLYFSDRIPERFDLGECAAVFHAMTTKRSALYRSARHLGVDVDDGQLIWFNLAGLANETSQPDCWSTMAGHVVVDLGENARQNIIPTEQLSDFLTRTTAAGQRPSQTHTVIVRPFRYGDAGAVSHQLDDGTTLLEHSPDGLLAINRGLANVQRTSLPPLDQHQSWSELESPERWTRTALHQVAQLTEHVQSVHLGAYTEWIVNDGRPTFIDFTIPNIVTPAPEAIDAVVLSPGTCQGPLVDLTDHQQLRQLSIAPVVSVNDTAPVSEAEFITRTRALIDSCATRPVIHAARPYAILSSLIGHVAGFVFDGGSTLCHLGILLREANCPAIIAPHPIPVDADGICTITNGNLYLKRRAAHHA